MKLRAVSVVAFVLVTACGTQKSETSSGEFEKAVATNEKLSQEVSRLRDERSQVASDLDKNNEKVSDLQGRIADLNKSGAQVETAYKSQLDTQIQTVAEFKAELAKLQVQLNNAPTPAAQMAAQQQIAALEAKTKTQDQRIAELKQLMETAKAGEAAVAVKLAGQIKDARVAYDAQVAKLTTMEASNTKLTSDLAAQQVTNKKLQDKSAELLAKNTELEKSLAVANTRIKQLELDLSNMKGKYDELKSIYTKTQDDLGKTKIDLGAAQASAKALQAELTALKLKYQQLETKNKELETQITQAKADAAKARADATAARAEADKAKAAAAAAQQAAAAKPAA